TSNRPLIAPPRPSPRAGPRPSAARTPPARRCAARSSVPCELGDLVIGAPVLPREWRRRDCSRGGGNLLIARRRVGDGAGRVEVPGARIGGQLGLQRGD